MAEEEVFTHTSSYTDKGRHTHTHAFPNRLQSDKNWRAVSQKIVALAGVMTKPSTLHVAHIFHHFSLP